MLWLKKGCFASCDDHDEKTMVKGIFNLREYKGM
jgi:hypothetical protein